MSESDPIKRLKRTRDQWAKCEPEVMACMSEGAIFHALNDAKRDVLAMHEAIEIMRRERDAAIASLTKTEK